MVSVVVPVHNEERSVEPLYDELAAALEPLDTDGRRLRRRRLDRRLVRRADAAPRAHENVRVVRLRRNFGKAAALAAGFAQARGDVIVTLDGDLQDDPAEIPRLLAKLDEGFDLVSGWKTRAATRWRRRIASRVFNRSPAGSPASACTT